MDALKQEINKLHAVIKQQDYQLKAKDEQLSHLENKVKQLEIDINDGEQYSRRNSIRIYGLPVSQNTSVYATVCDFFNTNLNIVLSEDSICSAHTIGDRNNSSRRSVVIVKLLRASDKARIIKERRRLKGSLFSIHEDMTKKNLSLLTRVRASNNVEDAWFANGHVYCRRDQRRFRVSLFQFVDEAAASARPQDTWRQLRRRGPGHQPDRQPGHQPGHQPGRHTPLQADDDNHQQQRQQQQQPPRTSTPVEQRLQHLAGESPVPGPSH